MFEVHFHVRSGELCDLGLKAFGGVRAPLLCAEVGQQAVACDAAQPRPEILVSSEVGQIIPCGDEHGLSEVIHFREAVEMCREITAEHEFVASDDMQVKVGFTPTYPLEQVGQICFVGEHGLISLLLSVCR